MSEYSFVPAGRNLAHDPRPVSVARISSGGSPVLVQDRSYSGRYSAHLTIPAGLWVYWTAAPDADVDIAAISGGTLSAALSVSGPTTPGLLASIFAVYADDFSHPDAEAIPIATSGTEFVRFTLPSVTIDDGRPLYSIAVLITNTDASAQSLYVGGLDIRHNQPIDAFIHGDVPGDKYGWDGAVNNSPSYRLPYSPAPIFGHGGQIDPRIRVEVVNRQGQSIRDITDHFIDGSVTYDMDAESWKGTCTLVLDEPGLIQPLADQYARIWLSIAYADGSIDEGSLGMFMVDPPKESWSNGDDTWSYAGRDMLALLDAFMVRGFVSIDPNDPDSEPIITTSFVINEGQSYADKIAELLSDESVGLGLSPTQYAFSGVPGTATDIIGFEAGASVLEILTEILQGAGWQKPWVSPDAVITGAPSGSDPSLITPSIILATGENSRLRWPFEIDPDFANIGNRVRVVSSYLLTSRTKKKKKKKKRGGKSTKRMAIDVIATNENPAHPLSFQRLGHWIDIPDIQIPLLDDEEKARAQAQQALIDAGQLPIRARLTTEVMIRGLNEVYELDMYNSFGDPIESGQGRYFCRGWSLQLGSPWEMVHSLSRVIPFSEASFL